MDDYPLVTSLSDIIAKVDSYTAKNQDQGSPAFPLFLIFFADWCPDCVEAEPVLQEALGQARNRQVLRIAVGDRPTWKDPDNEFRHSKFQVMSIPTLLRLEKGVETGRLVESEILDKARLEKFLRSNEKTK